MLLSVTKKKCVTFKINQCSIALTVSHGIRRFRHSSSNSRISKRALSTRYHSSNPPSAGCNVFHKFVMECDKALQRTPSSLSYRSVCGKSCNSTSELTCLFDTVRWVDNHGYSMVFAGLYQTLIGNLRSSGERSYSSPRMSIAGTHLRFDISRSLAQVGASAFTLNLP